MHRIEPLPFGLWAIALLAFVSFFVRRRALGRDTSPAGVQADAALRRQLRLQLIIGVLGLVGAALL